VLGGLFCTCTLRQPNLDKGRAMIEVLAVYFGIGLVISVIAIREDKVAKGFNPNAKDGDNDGLVQENTKWERKAKK